MLSSNGVKKTVQNRKNINYKADWRIKSWKESRLWKLVICAAAQKTADAANARLPASQHARQAVELQIRIAKTARNKKLVSESAA